MKVYIVRCDNSGEPESYIAGVYSLYMLAEARCDALTSEGEFVWIDEVGLDEDCWLSNR